MDLKLYPWHNPFLKKIPNLDNEISITTWVLFAQSFFFFFFGCVCVSCVLKVKIIDEKNGTCLEIDNFNFGRHTQPRKNDMSKNSNYFLSSINDRYQHYWSNRLS
jgi:hypothetical protein